MRQYEATVLKEGDFKPERVFKGEVARLNSYVTQRPPFDVKNPYMAPINVNKNWHGEKSDRYCMHIELGLGESRIRYEAGDHVAIYPTNDHRLVKRYWWFLKIVFGHKISRFKQSNTFKNTLIDYYSIEVT